MDNRKKAGRPPVKDPRTAKTLSLNNEEWKLVSFFSEKVKKGEITRKDLVIFGIDVDEKKDNILPTIAPQIAP